MDGSRLGHGLTPGKFLGLRRLADANGRFKLLSVDQRGPVMTYCAAAREEEFERAADVRAAKRLLIETLGPKASAVLADPGHALMDAVTVLAPDCGLIVTLEDDEYAEVRGSRMTRAIRHWSVSKARRLGANAVKVLVWRRPDQDAASLRNQMDFAKRVGDACFKYDMTYVLETMVYPLLNDDKKRIDYDDQPSRRTEHVLDAVEEFAKPDYGVDLFRLESPLQEKDIPDYGDEAYDTCRALFREMGRRAGRPWVLLSGGASPLEFREALRHAYDAGASGYLAGRAIWWDAFTRFPDFGAMEAALRRDSAHWMSDLNALTDKAAKPWTDWCDAARPVGFDEEDFPSAYGDCEGVV
jgi:tagatose 1,6-diphosphate aldolase